MHTGPSSQFRQAANISEIPPGHIPRGESTQGRKRRPLQCRRNARRPVSLPEVAVQTLRADGWRLTPRGLHSPNPYNNPKAGTTPTPRAQRVSEQVSERKRWGDEAWGQGWSRVRVTGRPSSWAMTGRTRKESQERNGGTNLEGQASHCEDASFDWVKWQAFKMFQAEEWRNRVLFSKALRRTVFLLGAVCPRQRPQAADPRKPPPYISP